MKPNRSDAALQQAYGLYEDVKIKEVIHGGGYTIGKDTLVIEVNRLAWGYFEQAILNAMKERQDLVYNGPFPAPDKVCEHCLGVGKFPLVGQEYEDTLKEHNDGLEESDMFYCKPGSEIARFCSPCQGTGIKLKEQG